MNDQQHTPDSAGRVIAISIAVVGGLAMLGVATSSAVNAMNGAFFGGPFGQFSSGYAGGEDWSEDDWLEDGPSYWERIDPETGEPVDEGFEGEFDEGQYVRASESGLLNVDVGDITDLGVDASGASFTLRFAEVDEAELDVQYTDAARRGGDWTLRAVDDELVVDRVGGAGATGGVAGIGGSGRDIVTLTLPQSLSAEGRLRGEVSLDNGELTLDGRFAELDLDLRSGYLVFNGSATEFDLGVRAGEARVEVADAREASIEVLAGAADAMFTGDIPQRVDVEAKAGRIDATLPKGAYRVEEQVTDAELENLLKQSPTSGHIVGVRATGGRITLQ